MWTRKEQVSLDDETDTGRKDCARQKSFCKDGTSVTYSTIYVTSEILLSHFLDSLAGKPWSSNPFIFENTDNDKFRLLV